MRIALITGCATAAVLVGAGLAAYAFRGPIGTKLAVSYLAGRGVPASIVIERLDPGGFAGSMRLGPANDPDLTVDRMEIEFEPIPLFQGGLAAPRIKNLRLVHPRLKGRYDGKKLTFGTLQPMIDEILAQPLVQPGPSFRVENGELRLDTYAGQAVLTGEAVVDEGLLRRAVGHLAATRLKLNPEVSLSLGGADLDFQGHGDRLTAQVNAQLDSVSGPTTLGATRIGLEASLPYGPQGFARLDGPVAGSLTADTASAAGQGMSASRARLTTRLSGDASGPMEDLTLRLNAEGTASADQFAGPGGAKAAMPSASWKAAKLTLNQKGDRSRVSAQDVTVQATADQAGQPGLSLVKAALALGLDKLQAESQGARWSFAGPLKLKATAARLDQTTPAGRLSLPALTLSAGGDAALASQGPTKLSLAGSFGSGAGGFDRKTAGDMAQGLAMVADEARIRAALGGFRIEAPAWRVALDQGGAQAWLDKPLLLRAAGDITASLSNVGTTPLLKTGAAGGGSGAAAFKLAGAGLPRVSVASPAYSLSKDGRLLADLSLDTALDAGQIKGGAVKGSGRLAASADGLAFTPKGCLAAGLGAMGPASAPMLQDASARLCGDGALPLLSANRTGWKLDGRMQDGAAKLPAAQVAAQGAELSFHLTGHDQSKAGKLSLSSLRVVDQLAQKRFLPVVAAGDFTLAGEALTGQATVRDAAKGATLVTADIRQSAAGPAGSAEIKSDLVFAQGGLQPADLSPLAKGMASEVAATLHFTGRAAWTDKGLTASNGRLTTANAAFKSSFGPVSGLAADLALTSLAPMTAAPGQTVTAQQLGWLIPLTDIKAVFGLTPTAITLSEAGATLAHGRASLGPLTAPLDPNAVLDGTLMLENVDIGELVSKSSMADSVSIQARVNGSLPFSVSPSGMKLTNGLLASIGSGRLSIKRQALTGAVATAGSAGAQPNAIQDFAYQALENLAFDSLEAKLESRPGGRLGAVFHLIGRNDPPGSPKARISMIDAIRGHAFDKPIPLPKATPVDLTLDTSLNFDELLKAYGAFGRNGSASVQP